MDTVMLECLRLANRLVQILEANGRDADVTADNMLWLYAHSQESRTTLGLLIELTETMREEEAAPDVATVA